MLTPISDNRKPITSDILRKILLANKEIAGNTYTHALYQCVFLLAFHACLRAGEIVVSASNKHTLKLANINNRGDSHLLTMDSFKHSKKPVTLALRPQLNSRFCPVSAMNHYLRLRSSSSPFLFVDEAGTPIVRGLLLKHLRLCLSYAGIDAVGYNVHSFRCGRATQLFLERYDSETIKSVGRWSSDAFQAYIRSELTELPR